jgi:hypothetical protein
MKALSIRQPWAHAIMELGKDIENRNWETSYRGPILIHASKTMPRIELMEADWFIEKTTGHRVDQKALRLGGIIGIATIVDCVSHSSSPWFGGPFGFVLSDPRPIPFIPYIGMLGMFEVRNELIPDEFLR